jgi:hypothetical protein
MAEVMTRRQRLGTAAYYWTLTHVARVGDWMTRHETDPITDPTRELGDNHPGARTTRPYAQGGEVKPSTSDGIPVWLNPGRRWDKELDE